MQKWPTADGACVQLRGAGVGGQAPLCVLLKTFLPVQAEEILNESQGPPL